MPQGAALFVWPLYNNPAFVLDALKRKRGIRDLAKINVEWKQSRAISLSEESSKLGFDLQKLDGLNADVQRNLKKAIISSVLRGIKEHWDKEVEELSSKSYFSDVTQGVYVISIAQGYGVSYAKGCSEVMYIGRGNFSNRIRSHLQNWIFDMSRSLRDVPFKFYLEELSDGRSPTAYKDLEHWLLEVFSDKFGEKPLLNKIAGREGSISHTFSGNCDAPLNNRGKKFLWEIRPLPKNPWFKPVADD